MNMIRTLTTDEIDLVAGAGYSLPSTLTSLSVTVGGPVATVSRDRYRRCRWLRYCYH